MEEIFEILEIKDETSDVKTFRLDGKVDFISGQYCLVSFVDGDDKRPFTFSSSPTKDYVEFTIKKMGEFTTKMYSLKLGDKLKIKGPKGDSLNFDESVKEDAVFIAGGSGITPFMSALRYAAAKNLSNKLVLLYSNRTEEDIIYKKELDLLDNNGNIKIVHSLTKDVSAEWDGEKGRISKEIIEKHVESISDKVWYICAPPPMVVAMKELLISMGVDKSNLRIEDWQIEGKHDEVK